MGSGNAHMLVVTVVASRQNNMYQTATEHLFSTKMRTFFISNIILNCLSQILYNELFFFVEEQLKTSPFRVISLLLVNFSRTFLYAVVHQVRISTIYNAENRFQQSCFLFWRYCFQISDQRLVILPPSLSPSMWINGYLTKGHNRFLAHTFHFIISKPF
jgi:hypothetical protein